jgi:hypothetical protein
MNTKYVFVFSEKRGVTFYVKMASSYPITSLERPLWFREVESPRTSRQSAHEGVKVISATHRPPLPPGSIPGTHFSQRLSRTQAHITAGMIISKRSPNDNIGNLTCDLPACSAVCQQNG